MALSARKILVTGGAGFIGSHLVDRLISETSARVVVVDNLSQGSCDNLVDHLDEPRLTVVEGDVLDRDVVARVMDGVDLVYHLAARSPSGLHEPTPEDLYSTNVLGSLNVLRAAAEAGVGHVIFASSAEVYGEPIDLPVSEDAPLIPIDLYGASKAAAEVLCRVIRRDSGMSVSILRLARIYGPRDRSGLVRSWLQQAHTLGELKVHGGSHVADFVWVGHVVEAMVRTAIVGGTQAPVNVGSGTGTKLVDVARRIARLADCPGQVRLLPPLRGVASRFVADVDRMRGLLLIEPPLDPLGWLTSTAGSARSFATA